ncbi:MAG: signal recognition particle protein [Chlamydiota bacterium]
MFRTLTKKFQEAFAFMGKGKTLNEKNLTEAIRSVRLALLDADVNYSVVSKFIKQVKEEALGKALLKSVKPKEQFVKIVHDALQTLMGSKEASLQLSERPSPIMLCGLQGAGKTTHAAKLAYFLQKKQKKRVLIAACDLQRPAAILQLERLAEEHNLSVFVEKEAKDPVKVAKNALDFAFREKFDVVIIDTAGRLHVDAPLMEELLAIKKVTRPQEVLFVASAATGQDAVKTAKAFNETVQITGSILTMLDGDARAGAAISIREETKKPLKFEGVGEKIQDLQPFHPKSMADRILGMGDIVNLVRHAEDLFDEQESKAMEEKIRKARFTYADYLTQMRAIKKMGSLKSLLRMLPGAGNMPDIDTSDERLGQIEAMILSMTLKERNEEVTLCRQRKERIAKGSGVPVSVINQTVKGFGRIKQMCKNMPKNKQMGSLRDLQKTMGKMKWH